jgi:hypothetical protein
VKISEETSQNVQSSWTIQINLIVRSHVKTSPDGSDFADRPLDTNAFAIHLPSASFPHVAGGRER